MTLPAGQVLETVGTPIETLTFLDSGIGALTTSFTHGVQVEVSMFGYESVIGAAALMSDQPSLYPISMLLDGVGHQCSSADAQAEFHLGEDFQRLMLSNVQAQLTISMQVAGCNAAHNQEQRLARWLLLYADRAKQDTLEMPPEAVAEMLGSTRSTVSMATARLRAKGLIDYSPQTIVLVDKPGLEAEACECYRMVRDHLSGSARVHASL